MIFRFLFLKGKVTVKKSRIRETLNLSTDADHRTRYTVKHSMIRFLTMGGGLLLIREITDDSPVLAMISRRN